MYLVKPNGRHLKWNIRFRNHDGKLVKVAGDADRSCAERLGHRIEMLVKAKHNADPPPVELRLWIDNMPRVLAERLLELGLLERRRIEQSTTMSEHIDLFEKVVAARKTNSKEHAKVQANRVRRVCKALKATSFKQITEDDVSIELGNMGLAASSRRHYIVAMKDFCKWAKKSGRAAENPLVDMKAPGQYEAPDVERVPFTVEQFRKLMTYLDGFDRYKGQQARWTASDRKIIYWTAVQSAFRKSELMSVRKRNLHFETKPPCVSIRAIDAKNRTAGEVPIPSDLAAALKVYVRDMEPDDRVFRFPTTSRSVIDMFRRDLTGAGIKWNFGEDSPYTMDFHTLRSTAITWWLDEMGLNPKRVQILARLKTLALVAKYSRNLRLQDFRWLNRGPKLVGKNGKRSA